MKIVIIGAVAGGASAAARARRLSEDAEIILFERGPEPSFANCGLPYYIGGEIAERGKLLVAPQKLLRERFRLDVRTRMNVERIDLDRKIIQVRSLETDRITEESYDKLIISTGASPIVPPIPGADLPNVLTLRDLNDADRMVEHIQQGTARATIIGGGFIGLEMAENLVHRDIDVTLIERGSQLMSPFDPEMTRPLLSELKTRGVNVLLEREAEQIEATDSGTNVNLKSGERIATDLIVMSIGVRPESDLAKRAGIELGERGGIKVNPFMQTSANDVYAVGDVVETRNYPFGHATQVPLGGPANRQGRIAADHIFGKKSKYRGTQGTAIVGLFGKAAAMTGLSEKAARSLNVNYEKVYIHPAHHAGYYPGAEQITLKMLFDPNTGVILGAQAVGGAGVDKRIDLLAMAIQQRMTVFDLEECELAYAPQFGSAKDPINMLGFVASNVVREEHPIVHVDQIRAGRHQEAFILDVRTPGEFEKGHVPRAINIPLEQLRGRLGELPQQQPIVAYCQVGQRGYNATRLLRQKGYSVSNLSGGYKTWSLFESDQ